MLLPLLSFSIKIIRLDECYETLLCSFMLRSILMHNFTSNCTYIYIYICFCLFVVFFISWPVLLWCSENNSHRLLYSVWKKKVYMHNFIKPSICHNIRNWKNANEYWASVWFQFISIHMCQLKNKNVYLLEKKFGLCFTAWWLSDRARGLLPSEHVSVTRVHLQCHTAKRKPRPITKMWRRVLKEWSKTILKNMRHTKKIWKMQTVSAKYEWRTEIESLRASKNQDAELSSVTELNGTASHGTKTRASISEQQKKWRAQKQRQTRWVTKSTQLWTK